MREQYSYMAKTVMPPIIAGTTPSKLDRQETISRKIRRAMTATRILLTALALRNMTCSMQTMPYLALSRADFSGFWC